MHFFNPAPIMKLVEVVSGLMTSKNVAKTVYNTANQWGKKPVYAASTPGFIVNRVARPFYAESLRLKQEGVADCATLDALIRGAGGFRMGAFELTDLIGHDVNYAVTCSVFDAYYGDFRFQPSLIQKELVEAGMLGRKTGQGFYSYDDGVATPEVQYCPVSDHIFDAAVCSTSGDLGVLTALATRLSEALGQPLSTSTTHNKTAILHIGDANVVLTDGLLASERAQVENIDNLVLMDLALNYETTTHLALSRAFGVSDRVFQQAVDGFSQMGIQVSEVKDSPGLVVMRTVAMLANEAADAALNGVASVSDIDIAMTFGVNYPLGPLAWGDRLGVSTVLTILNHLQQAYGEDRYRASLLIKQRAAEGRGFYE